MLGNHQQQQTERRPGSRRRRRGRSGEGIVKANRKTEICLHWRNGTCPYGAGSCAFAHGLGELRHPTMDDEMIADTVSEDSGSCPPSPRDPSPAHGPRQHSRDRRLPTFVHLSAGNTPDSSRSGARSSSTPNGPPHALGAQAAHRGRQRERTQPWPPAAHVNVHGCSTPLDLPIPAPSSTFGSEFSASTWASHSGSHTSSSNPGMEIYSDGNGVPSSSGSSSAMPSSFMSPRALQPLMVQVSQTNQQQQMGWEGAQAGGAPGGPSSFPHQNGTGPVWW